jgi:hypothetical protein
MNIQNLQRRQIARDILIHLRIHGTLSTQQMNGNVLSVVRILQQSEIIKMHENHLDLVIVDEERARFLCDG